MSTLDIILLVCFVPAIVTGIQRGFIAQVVSLVSIILGIWLAFHFSEMVCEWLRQYLPNLSETILNIVGFVLILTVVALLLHLVGKLLMRLFKAVDLGWLNWILGLIFSLLKAALIIGLVLVLFDTLNLKFGLVKADTLDQSVLYAPLRDAAYKVFPYLKALLFKQ
ncbi:MAG: CvpA family protein [Bacteroidales bacterium]|nr:CvpA family protein [Bacteroidales bacterium]